MLVFSLISQMNEENERMSKNKILYFKAKQFAAGELVHAANHVCSRMRGHEYLASVTLYRTLRDGTEQIQSTPDTSLLSTICDLELEKVSFHLSFAIPVRPNMLTNNLISVYVWPSSHKKGILMVRVDADSIDIIPEFSNIFQEEFKLQLTSDQERKKSLEHASLAEQVEPGEHDIAASH